MSFTASSADATTLSIMAPEDIRAWLSVRVRVIVIVVVMMIVIVRVRVAGHAGLHLIDYLSRELLERERCRSVRIGRDDWFAGVAAHHDFRIDRHFAEERDAEH